MSLLTGTVAESLEKGSAGVTVGTTPGADGAYSLATAVVRRRPRREVRPTASASVRGVAHTEVGQLFPIVAIEDQGQPTVPSR